MEWSDCLWVFQVIENYTASLDFFLLDANGFVVDCIAKIYWDKPYFSIEASFSKLTAFW